MPRTVECSELTAAINAMPLIDHHVHGAVVADLDLTDFELLLSESHWPMPAGMSAFDTPLGMAVRQHCAPLLGLPAFATPAEYLARRKELGAAEVNARLLRASGVEAYLVETGACPSHHTGPAEIARLSGANVHEVVRLETLAEEVLAELVDQQGADESFAVAFASKLDSALEHAVGVKSIAAYRSGLELPATPPSPEVVVDRVRQWRLRVGDSSGSPRLEDPVLIAHGVWEAVHRGCVVQFHVGFGDPDAHLLRGNPLLLMDFLTATSSTGARFTLLHCYPYQREAGYLCHAYPHVYADVGLSLNFAGASADTVLFELMELAPFGKLLFSSDAFGLAELHVLGAVLFRRSLARRLQTWRRDEAWPLAECLRIARMIARENAVRLYGAGLGKP